MSLKKQEILLIIDSHALIHRGYHALPKDMTSPKGEFVNAVYGFTSIFIKALKELKPDYVVATFDLPKPTFRHEKYKEYKATRKEADEDLKSQFDLVRELVRAFNIPILEKEGFEADDIIGTITEKLKRKDIRKVILTGDLDTLQLVRDDDVVVYTLRRGMSDTIIYDEEKVRERFGGIEPENLIDYKGLKGDPSDNIPGVPGVGEKTATKLLSSYKNIESLYKNLEKDEEIKESLKEKLEKFKDQALFSKELATIRRDAEIDFSLEKAKFNFQMGKRVGDVLRRFGFKSLASRLEKDSSFDTGEQGTLMSSEDEDEIKEYLDKGIFSEKIYKLEKELKPILRKIERRGFLIDKDRLDNLSKELGKRLEEIKKESHKLAGKSFNLNSPQEVGLILFEDLKLGGSRHKKTKTGAYSTSVDQLQKIKGEHKVVPLILEWRELSKLKSTYIDALPSLISKKDGRIHTTFKQFGAVTGRLSSEDPNLQNIPTKGRYGNDIRQAFIAPEGYQLISADYSQIELRVAASLSGDKKMIEAFEKGEDIHTRTAAEVFNVSIDKVDKRMRRTAKILNFGIQYGMGSTSFARSAEIKREEAKKFIEEYYNDFKDLAKFIEETKKKAYKQGFVKTLWGRKRLLPELSSSNPGVRASGERMAVNMPIQGTAADITKEAMAEVNKKLEGKKDINIILQVHDELLFEVKKDKVKEYGSIIKEVMENVAELKVPLVIDVEAGPNWGELKPVN